MSNDGPIYLFHGGCHGCTRQQTEQEGVDYCVGCQYFCADWNLPDLNNEPPNETDIERKRLMAKYGMKKGTR